MAKSSFLSSLKDKAIAKPTPSQGAAKKDAVAQFIEKAQEQIKFAEAVKKDGANSKPLAQWFKKLPDGTYSTKFGRAAIEIDGDTWFAAGTLDDVANMYESAIKEAQTNPEFQHTIRESAKAFGDALKAKRAENKAKK